MILYVSNSFQVLVHETHWILLLFVIKFKIYPEKITFFNYSIYTQNTLTPCRNVGQLISVIFFKGCLAVSGSRLKLYCQTSNSHFIFKFDIFFRHPKSILTCFGRWLFSFHNYEIFFQIFIFQHSYTFILFLNVFF